MECRCNMCLPKYHWKRGRTQHIAALHSDAFSTIKVWNGKLSLNFAIICHKVFWPTFFRPNFIQPTFLQPSFFLATFFRPTFQATFQLFYFATFFLPIFFRPTFFGQFFFWAKLKVSNNQYVFFRDNDEICFDFLHHLPGGKWLLPISKLTLFK